MPIMCMLIRACEHRSLRDGQLPVPGAGNQTLAFSMSKQDMLSHLSKTLKSQGLPRISQVAAQQ